jgi:hypothetical protein
MTFLESDSARPGRSESRSGSDVVVACAAVAAFGAAFSGAAPTGTGWWDSLITAALAVVFVVAATRAHVWAVFGAAAIAALFVGLTPWLVIAISGCAAFAASVVRPRHVVELRAAAGALSFLGLLHLAEFGFFGLSALLAGLAITSVLASAYLALGPSQRGQIRQIMRRGSLLLGAVLVVSAVQVALVRNTANAGVEAARAGIRSARAADTQELSQQLGRAQTQLERANQQVSSPLLKPLWLVPIAAQHLRSVSTATEHGLIVANEALAATEVAGIEELTLRQGQFDLDLLSTIAPRLQRTATSLGEAVEAIERDRSPWLISPVDSRLRSLLAEVDDVRPEAELAAEAARVMPRMLGAEAERRYLMLFGSPGEAREFGGFVGGYALISVDEGVLHLIQAGSINDLVPIANLEALDDPDSYPVEFVEADPAMFPQNLTSTPNITTVARAVRDIFPELLGAPIDGVIYIDPYALGAMTELTGPVSVEGIGEELIGADIVDFIFDGQYRLFEGRADRFEAIGELAEATAAQFADIDLPGPEQLGRSLGPVARAGRLQVVTYDDEENNFLTSVKLQRNFVAPTSVDSFAVIHTNGTASKLDLFLHRDIRYDVTVGDDGSLTAIIEVELRSKIPPNVPELTYGFTDGTNQVLLSLYSRHALTGLTVNGQAHEFVVQQEFGFFRYALFKIPLAANSAAQVRFELEGVAPNGPYRVGVWKQPAVNNDMVEIVYRAPGVVPVVAARELVEGWLFDPEDEKLAE